MSGQISAAEERVKYREARSSETQLALETLTDESSRTETKLCAVLSVVEESLTKKTCVKRRERKLATEVEKNSRYWPNVERRARP